MTRWTGSARPRAPPERRAEAEQQKRLQTDYFAPVRSPPPFKPAALGGASLRDVGPRRRRLLPVREAGLAARHGGEVVDVVVEGVSMLITQRDEFSSVIQRSGGQVEGLLASLRQRVR